MRRMLLPAGLLLILIGVGASWLGSPPSAYSQRTTGRVTALVPAFMTRSHQAYYVQAEFRDAQGLKHSCVSDWGVDSASITIGDQIPIRYVKDNPVVSYMPPPHPLGPGYLVLALAGLAVLLLPRALRWRERRQSVRA